MNHNNKKTGKIIDELTTYLLKEGCSEIVINVLIEDKTLIITFEFVSPSSKVSDLLYETLSQERDESIEEYGWELLGENDASGELNLIGNCIDKCLFEENGDKTKITMYRK